MRIESALDRKSFRELATELQKQIQCGYQLELASQLKRLMPEEQEQRSRIAGNMSQGKALDLLPFPVLL